MAKHKTLLQVKLEKTVKKNNIIKIYFFELFLVLALYHIAQKFCFCFVTFHVYDYTHNLLRYQTQFYYFYPFILNIFLEIFFF